jgi:hypothetical protein
VKAGNSKMVCLSLELMKCFVGISRVADTLPSQACGALGVKFSRCISFSGACRYRSGTQFNSPPKVLHPARRRSCNTPDDYNTSLQSIIQKTSHSVATTCAVLIIFTASFFSLGTERKGWIIKIAALSSFLWPSYDTTVPVYYEYFASTDGKSFLSTSYSSV